ncbi:MAG: type II secretion system protein [Phycisphaerae bacterium]|jgi:prepilin-type N-terminal cleavage/methylation domain-containing protein/prepilin-type processing-associated H-X9-DG protein
MSSKRAFTLIELLVVVAIIALLVAILIPSLAKARDLTRRVACASNVRQVMVAANMYANSAHPRGEYIPEQPVPGDDSDNLRSLYPRYFKQLDVAVCPNTKNMVRTDLDLRYNARSAQDSSGGHSFEIRNWMWRGYTFQGKKIEPDYVLQGGTWVERDPIKSTKNVERPAQVLLMTDADDVPSPNTYNEINNWPDPQNNHGKAGVNVGYCDGHATWTPTGRPLLMAFLTGYYNPNVPSSIYQKYGVTVSGNVFRW